MARLPTVGGDTNAWGTVLNGYLSMVAGINAADAAYAGGADPTGAVACDAAVLAALAVVPSTGGTVIFPAGTFLFSGSTLLALTTAGTVIQGAGMTATTLKIGAGFSAAALFSVDADNCTIADMQIQGASTTIASNPQCLGIQVRARNVCLQSLHFFYINGYCIKVINLNPAGSHQVNHQAHLRNLYLEKTSGGIWLNGDNDTIGAMLSDIHGNSLGGGGGSGSGTDATLDALRLEDAFDVDVSNLASSVGSGTSGHSIHLVGHCATVRMTGGDIGGFPTPATSSGQCAVKIEDGANGHSSAIRFMNMVFQTHDTGLSIPGAANNIRFIGCDFNSNNIDGVDLAGSGLDIYLRACRWDKNGQAPPAATNVYDVNWSGSSHGQITDAEFVSNIVAQGSAGVQFTLNFGARNRDQFVLNARFMGSGAAVANWVNGANTYPRLVRSAGSSPGLTPRQPAIAASTSAVTNDTGFDCAVYIAGGTVSAVAVGGTAITSITASPAMVRVPANQTVTLTYSSAPTWQWFGD